jgi:peptidoglycan/LPS O-acetylase OafA/YrhL
MTAGPGPEAARGPGFRPDIEGLRAVAVLLILLFHAGLPVAGGFIGVDVFFVISGFLITGLLIRELDETGRLGLAEFYARRVRRILPASFLVLGVTLLGCLVLFSPIGLWQTATDLAATAAYVPNMRFAFEQTDYFHPPRVSPVLHYWSLGVEEQFYLVWPVLLWIGHRLTRGRRQRLPWLVGALVAGSFALAVVATILYPTAAFYLLPTRAWELGVGALLALAPAWPRRLSARAVDAAALAGLAMVLVSAVAFTASTPFPGLPAAVPIIGTALLIVAGADGRSHLLSRLLTTAPMRFVGRISYSLYLWHWPLLVFAPLALPGLPLPGATGLAVALSVGLAWATYRWVEDPLRRGLIVGRRPAWNLATATVVSVALIGLPLGVSRAVIAPFRQPGAEVAVPIGADPFVGLIPAVGPTPDGPLPANLIPPVLHLYRGRVQVSPSDQGCSLRSGETVNGPCRYGNDEGSTRVVVFGDSHVAQWWPALERIMTARDWQLTFLVKTSCTYADITAVSDGGPKAECDTWRAGTLQRIEADPPDLVIVSANHRPPPIVDGRVLSGAEAQAAMAAGAGRTLARLLATGAKVVVLADTPRLPFGPAECLTANADHILRCAIPREAAVDPGWVAAERAVAEGLGATFVDVTAWACPSDPCPLVIGRYAVFADTNHLTRPFVQGLAVRLERAIVG